MKKTIQKHSIASLFSLVLFGLFTLFLLLILLFSAKVYQSQVSNTDSELSLGTASAYITTKFRQHDSAGNIFTGELDGIPALCFRDSVDGQNYITYIYLNGTSLKELFTSENSAASANAGTTIAELKDFQAEENKNSFFRITLTNTEGDTDEFYLHSTAADQEAD